MGVGVTRFQAQGAYSGQERAVLLCAVRRREIVTVRHLVKATDPDAFFIIWDAAEVLGKGFGEYDPNQIK